ncbi:MAG: M55 family metallopeptidase [Desulfobacterales bacterium]|jgi:D-aminopeptidase
MIYRVLIITDIEGSSGCWDRRASSFLTQEWARACLEMTRDVDAVVQALFNAGVERVLIKDFHRTGYNLLPEQIDARAGVIQGYLAGPVPGLGDPTGVEGILFMGMHAAAGTGGFLAHTLTSRIARLEVNGRPFSEVELFAACLAPFNLRPLFYTGCPIACGQAAGAIENIIVYPIDKAVGQRCFDIREWRSTLAKAAAASLANRQTVPYRPAGPFRVLVQMRDGYAAARKIAERWKLEYQRDNIYFKAGDVSQLFEELIRICYLTPLVAKALPLSLGLYNLWGRLGLAWVRRQIRHHDY